MDILDYSTKGNIVTENFNVYICTRLYRFVAHLDIVICCGLFYFSSNIFSFLYGLTFCLAEVERRTASEGVREKESAGWKEKTERAREERGGGDETQGKRQTILNILWWRGSCSRYLLPYGDASKDFVLTLSFFTALLSLCLLRLT